MKFVLWLVSWLFLTPVMDMFGLIGGAVFALAMMMAAVVLVVLWVRKPRRAQAQPYMPVPVPAAQYPPMQVNIVFTDATFAQRPAVHVQSTRLPG
ncbi:hypothetical protein [Mycobacteroides abscessus]|uniref:Transmembrane protein n=1 Tax=Mycobacteroides abscessus subsp. bolletii CRM-0020 TaxID=1306401 RepID=A0A829HLR7_9MYCO|nr:hypothetical protein [Mycobacteroides abscessus]EPQ20957.1 hypothetical protein J108_23375 [Mycobacteroides abscessus subsp. bolletii CRM-0020]RIS70533.1 hypothetical protein D2E54_24285 [Mycobacteroides abscessus]SLE98641.1 Uncharacterised protein [Mycobacteroides abscessus subsp. massiliense]